MAPLNKTSVFLAPPSIAAIIALVVAIIAPVPAFVAPAFAPVAPVFTPVLTAVSPTAHARFPNHRFSVYRIYFHRIFSSFKNFVGLLATKQICLYL